MLDFLLQIDELPKRGDDIYANSQTTTIGGCAYNVADILKHYDVPYTLFAPIGNGEYGNMISSKMVWNGHSSPLITKKGDNGYSLTFIDKTGERTFITLPGVECDFDCEWFESIDVSDYDCVYFSGYEVESSDAIVEFCENNPDLKVYYAPGPRIMNIRTHDRIMALNPVIHLNEKEALSFSNSSNYKDAAEYIFKQSRNTVIITLGSKGCYYKIKGKCELVPGIAVEQICDTVGAGDSHIGAFIANQQLSRDIQGSLEVANKVASTMVTQRGASMSKDIFDGIKY